MPPTELPAPLDAGETPFSLRPLSLLPDLEQRILRALRAAGSPVKSVQLAKECQVPKKKLNQVLYRMQKESKVSLAGLALWRLGEGGTGEVVPAEPAQLSQGKSHPGSGRARPRPGFNTVPAPRRCLDVLVWPVDIVAGPPLPGVRWEGLTFMRAHSRRSAEPE